MQIYPNVTKNYIYSSADSYQKSLPNITFINQTPLLNITNITDQPKATLFKTELCRNWLNGNKCQFGEYCYYAHGESERHDKGTIVHHYKNQLCESYHFTFMCTYGSKCNYKHENYERKYFYCNLDNLELKCLFITNKVIMGVRNMLGEKCSAFEIIRYIYEEGLSVNRLRCFKKLCIKPVESLKDLMEDCYELYILYDSLAIAIDEYYQEGLFTGLASILNEMIRDYLKIPRMQANYDIERLFSNNGDIFLGL